MIWPFKKKLAANVLAESQVEIIEDGVANLTNLICDALETPITPSQHAALRGEAYGYGSMIVLASMVEAKIDRAVMYEVMGYIEMAGEVVAPTADVAKYVDAMNELRTTYDIQKSMWFISKRLISDSGFNGDDGVLNAAITHYGTSCLISTVKLFREITKEFSITI